MHLWRGVESGMVCADYQVSLTNVIETREIGKLQMLSLYDKRLLRILKLDACAQFLSSCTHM